MILISIRKKIRHALKERLVGNTRALDQVTTNRALPWRPKKSSPGIAIYTVEDIPEPHTVQPPAWAWSADIGIEFYLAEGRGAAGGASTGEPADDDLDDFVQEVVELIRIDPTLGLDETVELLDIHPSSRGLEVGTTRQGERLKGAARLTWTWVYRMVLEPGDPVQVVDLERLGAKWDLPETGETTDAEDLVELEEEP